MTNRWALLVGVEKPLHPQLGTVAYAEADAKTLGDILASAGVPTGQLVLLTGPHATKAAVESHLRRLRKQLKKGSELLVVWAGPGFADGDDFLACWDTLPDDRAETAVRIADVLTAFDASKAAQVSYFLAASGLALDGLRERFRQSAKSVALVACGPGEDVLTAPAVKHGVWLQLVQEAFAGHARKAVQPDGRLTAVSVQRFIEDELPRRLRKFFEGGVEQIPQLLGEQNAAAVLLELAPPGGESAGVLDAGRLRRLAFRSETTSRVRDLTNFRKTFTVPDAATPSNRKFVQRIAADDVRAELNLVFEECREQFGYKRKDLDLAAGQDGTGTLRTPDFEYTVYVDLVPDEPSQLLWRREVGRFADAAFIRSPEFQAGFGAAFDQLVFELAKPIDVADFIDRVEDRPPPGVKLKVGGEGKACELTLAGFAGTITLRRNVVVVGGRSATATGLLDLFLQFLDKFGTIGEPLALPPARS